MKITRRQLRRLILKEAQRRSRCDSKFQNTYTLTAKAIKLFLDQKPLGDSESIGVDPNDLSSEHIQVTDRLMEPVRQTSFFANAMSGTRGILIRNYRNIDVDAKRNDLVYCISEEYERLYKKPIQELKKELKFHKDNITLGYEYYKQLQKIKLPNTTLQTGAISSPELPGKKLTAMQWMYADTINETIYAFKLFNYILEYKP